MNKKNRVIIVGNSPFPFENSSRNYAPGIRTWHFGLAAKDANYDVLILGCRIPKSYDEDQPDIKFEKQDDIEYYSVIPTIFENKKWLKEKIQEFEPDVIVGVNTYPCSIISDLELKIPFWADLNGSVMAEAQAKAFVYKDNSYIPHFFKMEAKSLSKADIFSTVSEAQGFSLVGELGIWGRLNKDTMGYRFVRVIPNSALETEFKHTKNVIRGVLTSKSDFVVLYSGGYNTWTDVDTLFKGLESAMSQIKNLVFVSTGGQIEGHDEYTYIHFQNLIKKSKFKNRFHLCGWVPNDDLPNYYLEADLAINSDKYCYEALLGSRTRTLDWIRAKLPFISTPLSEVTNYLIQKNLAFGFKEGNEKSLAELLVNLSKNPNDLDQIKNRLQTILKEEFLIKYTQREFIEWLKNPSHSPDYGKKQDYLYSKEDLINYQNLSIPKKQKLAVSSWPYISSFLRKTGLEKYENQIKKAGTNFVFQENKKNYKAKFLNVTIPSMESAETYTIPVVIQNIGNVKWETPEKDLNAVNFGYVWKDQKGEIVMKSEERTPLPKSVKPGEKIEFEGNITTLEKSGKLILELDLVKENQFWFSELDSEPYEARINVKKKQQSDYKYPKTSVVVISYNSEKYIAKCLDSLLESDYPNLELIVVDNSSSDKTPEILKNYSNKAKIFLNKENLGFAGGNNFGIKKSSGEILVLINPDAYVKQDSISELVLPFLKDEKIMITGPKIYYPNTKKIQSAGGIIRTNALPLHYGYGVEDNQQFNSVKQVDYVTGAVMAIKRKLFEITGLFDPIYNPAYYEETEKCVQARKLGFKVLYIPKSEAYHYESTTLTALSENYLRYFHANRFKFIYRNFNFAQLMKFFPSEIKWFFINCGKKERSIVIKAHLKSLFSSKIRNTKKVVLE